MLSNLEQSIFLARSHITMAVLLEPLNSEVSFKFEVLAWDEAYKVGLRSADDEQIPAEFASSRTLGFAWDKAREDRNSCAGG